MTASSRAAADLVYEPLADSARLQLELADRYCPEECRWYHGPRLYLRAVGVVRGVRLDTAFLLDAIGEAARRTTNARVLVSGAADYGTLAHVVTAFRDACRPFHVTVVDRCRTPLEMNVWYGAQAGLAIDTRQGDILALDAEGEFDLICTHAFFGRFDGAGRERLAHVWSKMLRPGGTVVTAHAVRPGTAAVAAPATPAQRQQLRSRIRAAMALPAVADATPEQLAAWTAEFVRRKTTRPVCGVDDTKRPLEAAGFDVTITRRPADDVPWRMGVVAIKRA